MFHGIGICKRKNLEAKCKIGKILKIYHRNLEIYHGIAEIAAQDKRHLVKFMSKILSYHGNHSDVQIAEKNLPQWILRGHSHVVSNHYSFSHVTINGCHG